MAGEGKGRILPALRGRRGAAGRRVPDPPREIGILIVIPVYNHGATLREVAEKSLAVHPEILVVDDGSTDGGAARLAGLPVSVIGHAANRGKGAAILTAAHEARRRGLTHLVTLDADGQHDPADIARFLTVLRQDPWAVLVGTRDFNQPAIPRASRFGRAFSNFWLRLQTGVSIGDSQSGFRAYPVALLEALHLREMGYAFEVEVLVKASWAGVALREVPVSVYYPPPGERISHFQRFRDNLRLSYLNTRLTLRALVPLPHRRLVPETRAGEKISAIHPLRSVRALLTENAQPRELAAAAALGVFLGTLPIFGFHTVVVLLAAAFFRLNRLAALGANQLCMPPFVPALCIEIGYLMRHGGFLTEVSWRTLGREALQRLWEWFLGSLIVAPVFALLIGGVVYLLARFLQGGTGPQPDAGDPRA